MVKELYVVRDKLALESGPIMECRNVNVARRAFETMIKDHRLIPADFELVFIGFYDTDSGRLIAEEPSVVDFSSDVFSINMEVVNEKKA